MSKFIDNKDILLEIEKQTQDGNGENGVSNYKDFVCYLDELHERYRAAHSVMAIKTGGRKSKPWEGCSNVGYMIEAIIIEALIPRLIKVTTGQRPVVQATKKFGKDLEGLDKAQANQIIEKSKELARKVAGFIDWQAFQDEWGFDMPNVKEIAYRIMLIEGSVIEKIVWDTKRRTVGDSFSTIVNESGEYIAIAMDSMGQMQISISEEPVQYEDAKIDEIVKAMPNFKQKDVYVLEEVIVRDRPKIVPLSFRDIRFSGDETELDPDDWKYLSHVYHLKLDDIKRKIGNTRDGMFDKKEVDKLISRAQKSHDDKNTGEAVDLQEEFEIEEWYGQVDVDGDGRLEEIIAFIADDNVLLGWSFPKTSRRGFFHNTIIPRVNKVRGFGVVEFISTIRDMLDKIYNLLLDHTQISIAPPIIIGSRGKVDVKKLKWGIGQKWLTDDVTQIREMQISRQDIQGISITEMLLAIVQKLFGVTDYSLGSESNIASNKTATGIVSLIQEANVKFDHFISRIQSVNAKEYRYIHKLNYLYLDRDIEYTITGGDMPYAIMSRDLLDGEFDFEMTGNTINTNPELQQKSASYFFNLYTPLYGRLPHVTDELIQDVMEMNNQAFGLDHKIMSIEELKKRRVEEAQLAVRKENYENGLRQVEEGMKSGQVQPEQGIALKAQLDQQYPDIIQGFEEASA